MTIKADMPNTYSHLRSRRPALCYSRPRGAAVVADHNDTRAVQSALLARAPQTGLQMKDARSACRARLFTLLTGEYDRADGDLRTAMRFNCADQDVKEELASLARVLGLSREYTPEGVSERV